MKRRRLTLKLITVIAVTSVLFGVASCHVNSTVQTDINTDVSSSEITESQTEPETVPPETTTELAPITVATTAASTSVETKEETTTTTTEETTAATEKVIKDLSPEWVRALSQAQDLGTNQMLTATIEIRKAIASDRQFC